MKRTCRNCIKYNNCFHAFTNDQICKRGHVMKGNTMNFKVGDKVDLTDNSWSFGFRDGKFEYDTPHKDLRIIKTNIRATIHPDDPYREGEEYCKINDLLVRDKYSNPWFVQSRFCKSADKKIELRYFVDGEDVTDNISDETKRNLAGN